MVEAFVDRRQFLRLVAIAAGAQATDRFSGGLAFAKSAPTKRPRYFVQLVLDGGMDTVFTTDPKAKGDVESWVDRPYNANDIVDAGGIAIGPHWKALAPWLPAMAIIQAVEVSTANHESGTEHLVRLRTETAQSMPTILDIIGQSRDSQALGSVHLGIAWGGEYTPGWFADTIDRSRYRYGAANKTKSIFQLFDQLDPGEARLVASALSEEAARLDRRGETVSARNVTSAAALFARGASVPRFAPQPVRGNMFEQMTTACFARCLWLLENDLAKCVFMRPIPQAWDTHSDNESGQSVVNPIIADGLAWFLSELERRQQGSLSLADQTLLITSSELGRFPRINSHKGKDHFPQTSYLMKGPGLITSKEAGQTFSPTGRAMESLPISMKTGQPTTDGRHLQLDDVGATVLTLAGLDPVFYGYTGQLMRFAMV